jgi:TfoX/Sxy family transcriptional regulator of competence genes
MEHIKTNKVVTSGTVTFRKLVQGVELFVDGKSNGIFPTEKRARLFISGERDREGNRIVSEGVEK